MDRRGLGPSRALAAEHDRSRLEPAGPTRELDLDGVRQITQQRRRNRQLGWVAATPVRTRGSRNGRVAILWVRSVRDGRRATASPRASSVIANNASTARIGSNSSWNGKCGRSIIHDAVSPAVRTRACSSRRCGPLVSKSSGMSVNPFCVVHVISRHQCSCPAHRSWTERMVQYISSEAQPSTSTWTVVWPMP